MNTLRAKIALLLVVAIVSVVGILTWVMIALLGPPPPQRTTEPLADQVEMFLRVAKQTTSALTLVPEPSGGDPRENATGAAHGPSLPSGASTFPSPYRARTGMRRSWCRSPSPTRVGC